MFGLFRVEVWRCVTRLDNADVFKATIATKPDKQPAEVWAGPLGGPQIAQQSEKARRRQIELALF